MNGENEVFQFYNPCLAQRDILFVNRQKFTPSQPCVLQNTRHGGLGAPDALKLCPEILCYFPPKCAIFYSKKILSEQLLIVKESLLK